MDDKGIWDPAIGRTREETPRDPERAAKTEQERRERAEYFREHADRMPA